MACSSSAGFRHGSIRKTWLAAVRLMPTAPLRARQGKTGEGGGTARWRAEWWVAGWKGGEEPAVMRRGKGHPQRDTCLAPVDSVLAEQRAAKAGAATSKDEKTEAHLSRRARLEEGVHPSWSHAHTKAAAQRIG
eukprot:184959-Chlamydomonas_euryale.AAC.2